MSVDDQLTFNRSIGQWDYLLIYYTLIKAPLYNLLSETISLRIIIEDHVPRDFERIRKSWVYARVVTLLKIDHRNSMVI